jgi:O-acetyl-ADP-ribose deacetylase (regulator of RNase III)
MKKTVSGVTVECTKGDITAQPDIAVIVNAANAQLRSGGGVAGAIHRAAGPGLAEECRPLAPIRPGEAVISGGHKLPNRFVVHCLGPVYGADKPEDVLLARCYRNSLLLADERGADSIAFPAVSTGVFGYPMEEAAEVALNAISGSLESLGNVKIIRIVLFGSGDLQLWERMMERIF